MTREQRLELLKQIEKDIYVPSIESTFLDEAKSCAIHSAIEELEQEPILDKIREQFKSNLRGVEIALEVLVENHPLRPKMEGAKDTLEECLELIDKAETEAEDGQNTN